MTVQHMDNPWQGLCDQLECERPRRAERRHPDDGRLILFWTWCGVCLRCAATLDENGEKP